MSELPVVLVPVGVDDDALDACLAALDAGTPPGTRVWLADDAQAGPRGLAIAERWLARTALQADYTRRPRSIGEAAHLDEMLRACGDADVLVLASDAVPLPGWAVQLVACAARDPAIATATPWCNAGETASWPCVGEVLPVPDEPARLARAAASLPPHHPELPAAVNHAVFLRGSARQRAGGVDAASYASWHAALVDLSLRMAGLGWRNVLCETAFVARGGEGMPLGDDVDTLAARWPTWHARLAQFLMQDPLHTLRAALGHAYDNAELRTQPDLFTVDAAGDAAASDDGAAP
ncbi:MAG: glycosyltransferase [Xanthomonadales bacterium]|nr:glycosyltransferase [Xanthomonadales bacterium]